MSKSQVTNNKPKKENNPIIIMMALLISNKFAGYPGCPAEVVVKYNKEIEKKLKEDCQTAADGIDQDNVDLVLDPYRELKRNCKKFYSIGRVGNNKMYTMSQFIDDDMFFKTLISNLPENFVRAATSFEALTVILGTMVSKKADEVWAWIYENRKVPNIDCADPKKRVRKPRKPGN